MWNKGWHSCCRSTRGRREEKPQKSSREVPCQLSRLRGLPGSGLQGQQKGGSKTNWPERVAKGGSDLHPFWRQLYCETSCLGRREACSELLMLQFKSTAQPALPTPPQSTVLHLVYNVDLLYESLLGFLGTDWLDPVLLASPCAPALSVVRPAMAVVDSLQLRGVWYTLTSSSSLFWSLTVFPGHCVIYTD